MAKLKTVLKKFSKLVNPKIKKILGLYLSKSTKELANYQIDTGGKRLRPALAILSCLVCGGKMEDVIYPAAGLEIFHEDSLIIDDIIDNSLLRRGQKTTWAKFGPSIAQCLSFDYSASFFQTALRSKFPKEISEVFAWAMKTVFEGEILDILFEQAGREEEPYVVKNRYRSLSENDYLQMIGKKTASLAQACCEVGAICAEANAKEVSALKNFGLNLGLAFQIIDDTLDIFGDRGKFGKKIGGDIKERKLGNIIIFYAFREMPEQKKKKVLTVLRKKEIQDKDIREVIRLVKSTDAREKALKLSEKYIERAKESLKLLPQNNWNKILEEIADFVAKRET